MKFKVIRFPEQLRAYKSCWNQICPRSVFQTFEWIYACAHQLEDTHEICILCALEETPDHRERWLGAIPLCIEHGLQRRLRTLPFSRGMDTAEFFMAAPDQEAALKNRFVELLSNPSELESLLGKFDVLVLENGVQGSHALDLSQSLQSVGYRGQTQATGERKILQLPGTLKHLYAAMNEEQASQAECLLEFVDLTIETRTSRDVGVSTLWEEFKKLKVAVEPDLDDLFADDKKSYWLERAIEGLARKGMAEIRTFHLESHTLSSVILLGDESQTVLFDTAISPFATLEGIEDWTFIETVRHLIEHQCQRLVVHDAIQTNGWPEKQLTAQQLHRTKFVPPRLGAVIKDRIITSGQLILESVFSPNG